MARSRGLSQLIALKTFFPPLVVQHRSMLEYLYGFDFLVEFPRDPEA